MSAKVNNLNTLNMKNPIFYSIFKPSILIILSLMLIILRGSAQNSSVEPYDILISEFMANPQINPNMPGVEYIELYNRSNKIIKLKGFKLINGSDTSSLFPDTSLLPKKYVIVYARKSGLNLSSYGDTISLPKFPTLSNPNDIFSLKSPKDSVIDAASYDLSYYQDAIKAKGGYSLERININAFCSTNNWIASKDLNGGTPGKKNSVYQDTLDKTSPEVILAYPENSRTIVLNFDKSMKRDTGNIRSQISIDNNLKIDAVKILDTIFFTSFQLKLNSNLSPRQIYKLILKTTLKDCKDIPLSKEDTIKIQLPKKVGYKDLIINELLMNPEVGGSRFLEIYNRSDTVVDLFKFIIKDIKKNDEKPITSHYPLFPKEYVALTENPLYIQNRYKASKYKKAIIKNKLPTWDDVSGNVTLYNESKSVIIDTFNYNKSYHNPLLPNTEGVSLERINPNESTNNAANWHSAAASVLYATPAYQNSQLSTTPSVSSNNEEIFKLLNKTFSPNDDGFQDYLLMHYSIDKKGYLANISIYDMEGRLVKRLTINELLTTEGQIKWDGETDERLVASVGTYIIYIELIDPDGGVKKFKKLCVLADKF